MAWAEIALPERLNTRGGDSVTAPEGVVIIAIDGFYLLAGLLAGLLAERGCTDNAVAQVFEFAALKAGALAW